MSFIIKKRGQSPETNRLWIERNQILIPERTRIVGKGKDSERIQKYRLSKLSRKTYRGNEHSDLQPVLPLLRDTGNVDLREFQQYNNEVWLNNNISDGEQPREASEMPNECLKAIPKAQDREPDQTKTDGQN